MCLYPKLLPNPKYKPNKKNNYNPPKCTDPRTKWVPVGCQKCIECMKQRARGWKIRLLEEIKEHKGATKHFITLTLSNESIKALGAEIDQDLKGYERDNEIATLAVRRFTERWRAKYGKTIKHWLVTELGHNGTENIHLHGILFTTEQHDIANVWKYGYVWVGTYVNEATVNYIIKYCTKTDLQHTYYKPKILTSKGIGNKYTTSINAKKHHYKKGATDEAYRSREGYKMAMPPYYRNKIFTDEQREKLWIEKLDKYERWVDGSRVSIKHGYDEYNAVLKQARRKNARLGYGNDDANWNKEQYENERRDKLYEQRTDAITGTNRSSGNTGTQSMESLEYKTLGGRGQSIPHKELERFRKRMSEIPERSRRTDNEL